MKQNYVTVTLCIATDVIHSAVSCVCQLCVCVCVCVGHSVKTAELSAAGVRGWNYPRFEWRGLSIRETCKPTDHDRRES